MKHKVLAVGVVLLLTLVIVAQTVERKAQTAAPRQHYQLFTGQVETPEVSGKGYVVTSVVLLLDAETGKVWRYQSETTQLNPGFAPLPIWEQDASAKKGKWNPKTGYYEDENGKKL
jgi:hypothetical protein